MAEQEQEWIGVDLDGTLARDYGWKGVQHIGSPIHRMVRRVRRWHNEGKRVKIFTARAANSDAIPYIKAWLKKNRLPDLEITNVKDRLMVQLWDDKAVPMRVNKGTRKDDKRIAESVVTAMLDEATSDIYREFPDFIPYWVDPEGEIWQAMPGGHIKWGQRRFNIPAGQPVMTTMERMGWLRMVVRNNEVWIDTYKATSTQLRSVRDWAIERRKIVYDEKTQRPYYDPDTE